MLTPKTPKEAKMLKIKNKVDNFFDKVLKAITIYGVLVFVADFLFPVPVDKFISSMNVWLCLQFAIWFPLCIISALLLAFSLPKAGCDKYGNQIR